MLGNRQIVASRCLSDAMPVLLVDRGGTLVFCNESAEAMLGCR